MENPIGTFEEIAAKAPIVPVLVVDNTADAAPLARALQKGGAIAVEVTLRTPTALDSIREMKKACPSLLVGSGTVLSSNDVDASIEAGVDFIVTPGVSTALIPALQSSSVPVCPGINSPSAAMEMYDRGFTHQKFFPAGVSGGANFLKAISGPLQRISFMPTGGVTADNMSDYLSLPNVFAVGGSWIAPPQLVSDGDFGNISKRMQQAISAHTATKPPSPWSATRKVVRSLS